MRMIHIQIRKKSARIWMRMILNSRTRANECVCVRGGGQESEYAVSHNTRTYTHIYTYNVVCVCRGGEGRVIDVVSPERGWGIPHWFMCECIGSYIWMCQWAPELMHQKIAVIPPEKWYGVTTTNQKRRRMGMCMNESVSFETDASRNYRDPTQKNCCHQLLLPTKKKKLA